MRKAVLFSFLVVCAVSPQPLRSQSTPAAQPEVRYDFGDNAAWSSPTFDDSSWSIAPHDSWPGPPFHSDGFVWIRTRVPVPATSTRTLAIRITELGVGPQAYCVFVSGRNVGCAGGFPPKPEPVYIRPWEIFLLPAGTAVPGSTVTVAVRLWYVPGWQSLSGNSQLDFHFSISNSDSAHLAERATILSAALGEVPDLALNALLALVGVGLLVFWFWSRRSELLWCAVLLAFYPANQFLFDAARLGFLPISWGSWASLAVLAGVPCMIATVEFIWTVHRLRAPRWRRAAHVSWVVYNAAILATGFAVLPSAMARWSYIAVIVSVQTFNAITLGANLWVLLIRRYNLAIAAAMAVIPIASALGYFGSWQAWTIGIVRVDLFDLGFLLSGFAIAAMLIQRAVQAWRKGNDLRVEFEAAREVQQQLVSSVPQVPGFTIASVYAPAKQVGGDFYRILPDEAGGILVVVGDVSGKGLPAAMTVSAIMGALRTLASAGPAELLSALNRSMIGNLRGGFVTCCAMRIAPDGSVRATNAGHLAPYCGGEEVALDPGLPLGITSDAGYSESGFVLAPGQTLTFLSDGVVEAQSTTGELFGFERTRAISAQSAEEIARAAQDYGQQDDITVLTLTFAPAEVIHA